MSARKWTPEQAAVKSAQMKAHWANPEYRARTVAALAAANGRPERRADLARKSKAHWASLTPAERAAFVARLKIAHKDNPVPPKIDPAVALKLHLEGKNLRAICDLFPGASRMAASRSIRRAKARGIAPAPAIAASHEAVPPLFATGA